MTPVRTSVIVRFVTAVGTGALHIVVGVAGILGGCWLVWYQETHPPVIRPLVYLGVGIAIFFALTLPTILPGAKQVAAFGQQIVVFVWQYIPVVGGRRDGDIKTAPPPAPPADKDR